MHVFFVIDTIDEDDLVAPIKERLDVETLTTMIINFDSYGTMNLLVRVPTLMHHR